MIARVGSLAHLDCKAAYKIKIGLGERPCRDESSEPHRHSTDHAHVDVAYPTQDDLPRFANDNSLFLCLVAVRGYQESRRSDPGPTTGLATQHQPLLHTPRQVEHAGKPDIALSVALHIPSRGHRCFAAINHPTADSSQTCERDTTLRKTIRPRHETRPIAAASNHVETAGVLPGRRHDGELVQYLGARSNSAAAQAGPTPLKRDLPSHAGAVLIDLKCSMHNSSVSIANHSGFVFSAAVLYKWMRSLCLVSCDWQDMDFVLSSMSSKKPLIAKDQTGAVELAAMAKLYLAAFGVKDYDFAKDGMTGPSRLCSRASAVLSSSVQAGTLTALRRRSSFRRSSVPWPRTSRSLIPITSALHSAVRACSRLCRPSLALCRVTRSCRLSKPISGSLPSFWPARCLHMACLKNTSPSTAIVPRSLHRISRATTSTKPPARCFSLESTRSSRPTCSPRAWYTTF